MTQPTPNAAPTRRSNEALAPDFTVRRIAVREEGAFGVLLHHRGPEDRVGTPFAVTLERTYSLSDDSVAAVAVGGQRIKIPPGRYSMVATRFHRGGYDTYEVFLIAGQSRRLLFHRGNVEAHSEGCVLVAESFGVLASAPAVLDSAAGFAEFMSRAAGRPHLSLEVA